MLLQDSTSCVVGVTQLPLSLAHPTVPPLWSPVRPTIYYFLTTRSRQCRKYYRNCQIKIEFTKLDHQVMFQLDRPILIRNSGHLIRRAYTVQSNQAVN